MRPAEGVRNDPLLQHVYGLDDALTPWRVVIVSLLTQRTTGDQVRKVVGKLFHDWPEPGWLAESGSALEHLLRPLGFQNQRARRIRLVSAAFDSWRGHGVPTHVEVRLLPGCGEYVEQAYRMIVEGDLTFEPEDKELKAWRASQTSVSP